MEKLFRSYRFPLLFIVFYGLSQWAYHLLPEHFVREVLVHRFTVVPAAVLINVFLDGFNAVADGTRLVSGSVRLNVLRGCEGTEVVLMLMAAIAAALRPVGVSLMGLFAGIALIFAVNQLRILALFFVTAFHRDWFELIHGVVAPLLVIAAAAVFFLWWLGLARDGRWSRST
jgi:exosortase family protein XrtM